MASNVVENNNNNNNTNNTNNDTSTITNNNDTSTITPVTISAPPIKDTNGSWFQLPNGRVFHSPINNQTSVKKNLF